MRKLLDSEGKEVEVPDEAEIEAMRAAQEKLTKAEEELKIFNDGKGVKNLREVLGRRDEELEAANKAKQELEAKLAAGEFETKAPEPLTPEKVHELIQQGIHGSLVGVEVQKALAGYTEEDRKVVKRLYDKLTAGEQVDVNNVGQFIAQARGVAFPEEASRGGASHGGRAARSQDEEKGFGDTEEGADFAKRMGLKIEAPKKVE